MDKFKNHHTNTNRPQGVFLAACNITDKRKGS